MSQPKIKATVVDGGEKVKPVNPYDGNFSPELYDEFVEENPALPLIPPRPDLEGQEIDTDIIWQYQFRMGGEWETATPNIMSHFDNYEAFATYYYNQNDCATRRAYQLVEAEKEETPIEKLNSFHTRMGAKCEQIMDKYLPEPSTPIVKGSEESVESKAKVWFDGMAEAGYNRDTIFEAGYKQGGVDKQDEVVAIIEKRISYLKTIEGHDAIVQLNEANLILATINKNL